MATIRLVNSESIREQLTYAEIHQIKSLYYGVYHNIHEKWMDAYDQKGTISGALKMQYLDKMEKDIDAQIEALEESIKTSLPNGMYEVAEAVTKDISSLMSSAGFGLKGAYSNIPEKVVQNILTGQIYGKDWSYSKAIWQHGEKTKSDIHTIVAKGVAENRSIYDIAKDLEKYVNPDAKKEWDWSKMYPGTNKKVDYNAQRLANTLISHAYQQSFIATTEKNPFFTGYKWLTSHSHRGVCEICRERAETDQYGLGTGVFPKDKLPLDHPNGVCTYAVVTTKSRKDMTDDIAKWYHSPKGTYPELDKFANSLLKSSPIDTVEKFVNKFGHSTKTMKSWYGSIPKDQLAIAKTLKQQSGLTWEKWYEKYIYNGDGKNLAKAAAKKKVKTVTFDKHKWLDALNQNDLYTMEKWCDKWLHVINGVQKDAVTLYTSSAYSDMNSYLRGIDDYLASYLKKAIEDAKVALNKASLPQEVITRRGSDRWAIQGLFKVSDFKEVANNPQKYIGTTIKDEGFLSTSPDPHGGFDDETEFVIKVPKGAPAMYVAPISEFESEKELLLNAGSSFIVNDIEVKNGVIKRMFMTLTLK